MHKSGWFWLVVIVAFLAGFVVSQRRSRKALAVAVETAAVETAENLEMYGPPKS